MIYNFETERKIPKNFRTYRMVIEFFEYLRDGDVTLNEVFRNEARFKADQNEMEIESNKFWSTRKNYWSFKNYSFLLSEAKYKIKY